MDALRAITAMQNREVSVFFALGGHFVAAVSDSEATEAAVRGCDLTVPVSTKLNRSHAVIGTEALVLPSPSGAGGSNTPVSKAVIVRLEPVG